MGANVGDQPTLLGSRRIVGPAAVPGTNRYETPSTTSLLGGTLNTNSRSRAPSEGLRWIRPTTMTSGADGLGTATGTPSRRDASPTGCGWPQRSCPRPSTCQTPDASSWTKLQTSPSVYSGLCSGP